MIVLYSTDCPKCRILEKRLDSLNISYQVEKDVGIMLEKGFVSAPMLEVDGNIMDFKSAMDWIKREA